MNSKSYTVTILNSDKKFSVDCNGNTATCGSVDAILTPTKDPSVYNVQVGNTILPVYLKSDGISIVRFSIRGYQYEARVLLDNNQRYLDMLVSSPAVKSRTVKISTPMPGLLKNVLVSNGDAVRKGDALFTLEAMKMENAIVSPINGIIKDITASVGQTFEKGTQLCIVAHID